MARHPVTQRMVAFVAWAAETAAFLGAFLFLGTDLRRAHPLAGSWRSTGTLLVNVRLCSISLIHGMMATKFGRDHVHAYAASVSRAPAALPCCAVRWPLSQAPLTLVRAKRGTSWAPAGATCATTTPRQICMRTRHTRTPSMQAPWWQLRRRWRKCSHSGLLVCASRCSAHRAGLRCDARTCSRTPGAVSAA